jgi:hypothetical protein
MSILSRTRGKQDKCRLVLGFRQDPATVLSEGPYREDAPELGVTDHAISIEHS